MQGGKRRRARPGGFLLGACLLLIASANLAQAQPKKEEYRDFIVRMRGMTGTNAAQAVTEIRNYLAANESTPLQTAGLYAFMASLQSGRLKDPNGALVTLDDGINKLGEVVEANNLIGEKARLLMVLKRAPEAVAALEPAWPRILENGSPSIVLPTYVDALESTQQDARVIPVVTAAMTVAIGRDNEIRRVLPILEERLLRANRGAEALAWAKLGFIVYPYEEFMLQDIIGYMSRALTSMGRSPLEVRQFVDALQTPNTASPLRAVKLPSYDTDVLRKRLATAPPDEKVGILLALGEQRTALLQARRVMLDQPTSQKALLQICRVAKAVTLNLNAANDFLLAYENNRTSGSMQTLLRLVETPETQRPTATKTP